MKPRSDSTVVLHSQLLLLTSKMPMLAPVPENNESLWNRVNRICDRYMPTHRSAHVPEQAVYQSNLNLHLSWDCQEPT